MPWRTRLEYDTIEVFDEESNKPTTTRASGLLKFQSKLINRGLRLVSALLVCGFLIHLCLISTTNMTLSMPKTPTSNLTELSIAPSSSYHQETGPSDVDWSKYAYTQYVTNPTYLCNSLMIFESLHRLGSRAERLMMYPEEWSIMSDSSDAALLRKARDEHKVILQPVRIQTLEGEITWSESFTKLLAFNQTQYERVIILDSDANVLQVSTAFYALHD